MIVAMTAALLLAATGSAARSAPDPIVTVVQAPPTPFTVPLSSLPRYAIAAETSKTFISADDGTQLFIETWLPSSNGDDVPPPQLPTIMVFTPYQDLGTLESASTMLAMVPRGYAYSQVHVRGTGLSGGCIDLYGPTEAADGADAVQWLATQSPWANGVVGAFGVSYPGGTILNTAGRGDPTKTQYLKAVLAGAPALGLYESAWLFDGVPSLLIPQAYIGQYLTTTSLRVGEANPTDPVALLQRFAQKPGCYPDHVLGALDLTGDVTPYFAEREGRDYVQNIKAAVFTFHGHQDLVPLHGVPPMIQVGLFDRLPATTPKFGIFGVFGHENPSSAARGPAPELRRGDFLAMEIAWFDHYLKGVGSLDGWGVAQVQGSDGRWRKVNDWPRGAGVAAKPLLLGSGTLGAPMNAAGATSTYLEGGLEMTSGNLAGTSVAFDTGPLTAGLELTGQATLELWLQLVVPDAHVAAILEAFDATGAPLPLARTYALRSAQHRDPFFDGRFVQPAGTPAPVLTPFALTLRFQPTDIVVPPGGRLRLTVAGSVIVNSGLSQLGVPEPLFLGPSQPSGVVGPVTILHDASHPSALRFESPDPAAEYIAPVPL
ncbi:MAG: CocE/NonD family hydrolase [Acidimicrobiales bacterium]